ncbi:MAG: cytochrome d ubiquinol oxidase subunit II [Acidimicrobiia bacterium]|nr:cytochrome d ubiquinol oxidase subunit II [Acidimicrobiia bacterium]
MIETDLNSLWFLLIAVLWMGYFFLEGFDFGVGILLPFVGRDDLDRRVAIRTIGPVWDGNEVWLIVAGATTFAAFPEWYATLFSGFYLPLFLILVALILRGVAFEFRAKDRRPQWRAWWDRAIFFGSAVPALLWGVAFGNIVRGVPIDAAGEYAGGFWNLLNPYALLGGLTTLLLFILHGASFLGLKAAGPVAERAHRYGALLALPTVAVAGGFLAWTLVDAAGGNRGSFPMAALIPVAAVAAAALAGVFPLLRAKRDGWAFVATGVTIVTATLTLFMTLYPRVMPSSTAAGNSLDIYNAASTPTTLRVMTVVALIFLPIVLAYQAWSYWVFRKRVTREQLSPTG